MMSKKLTLRLIFLGLLSLSLNQIACSRARLGATGGASPQPEVVAASQEAPESGEVVRGDECEIACDTGELKLPIGAKKTPDTDTKVVEDGSEAIGIGTNDASKEGVTVVGVPSLSGNEDASVGIGSQAPVSESGDDDSKFLVGDPVASHKMPKPNGIFPGLSFIPPAMDAEKDTKKCTWNTFSDIRKKEESQVKGVSLWLVVDSSQSFDEERLVVAKSLVGDYPTDKERNAVKRAVNEGFITSLRRQVPVTISVIAAHAPSSAYKDYVSAAPAKNPSIFYQHTSGVHSDEPLQVKIYPGMTTDEVKEVEKHLLTKLGEEMRESPISKAKADGGSVDGMSWNLTGPHSGSDELGLRNFIDAMEKAKVPEDNAWVVLFMSDENDVCVPFEKTIKGTKHFIYSHKNEKEMHERYCDGVTVDRAYNAALKFAGKRPFVLGSLVYTNQGNVPYGIQHSVGRGYLDLVKKHGHMGATIDLASANDLASSDQLELQTIANRLVKSLAIMTSESDEFFTELPIKPDNGSWENRVNIRKDVSSYTLGGKLYYDIQVYVDGRKSKYTVDVNNGLVQLTEFGKEVKIRYCLK